MIPAQPVRHILCSLRRSGCTYVEARAAHALPVRWENHFCSIAAHRPDLGYKWSTGTLLRLTNLHTSIDLEGFRRIVWWSIASNMENHSIYKTLRFRQLGLTDDHLFSSSIVVHQKPVYHTRTLELVCAAIWHAATLSARMTRFWSVVWIDRQGSR